MAIGKLSWNTANGGELPQPVEQGSATPSPYEDQIFDAQVNELVGPIDTGDRGFLLLEVTKDTPGKTQPLDDQLKQQITAAIVNNRQQQVFYDFQKSFFEKWTARTYCTSAADSEFCSGYEAPETEPAEGEPEPPPVQSTQPIEPGTSEIPLSFPSGYQPTQGTLPQGPGAGVQLPATDATTLPAGFVPRGLAATTS